MEIRKTYCDQLSMNGELNLPDGIWDFGSAGNFPDGVWDFWAGNNFAESVCEICGALS